MASRITGQSPNGSFKQFPDQEFETVDDVRIALGLGTDVTAVINGETANMEDSLEDNDWVSFAKSAKAG